MSVSASTVDERRVLADLLPGTWVRDVVLVVGYAYLIGLSAQFAIPLPFTDVPITGQTFAVLLGAAALGSLRGGVGSALYLGAGIVGVNWFAPIGGPSSLGYIVGFVFAAALVGWLAERGFDRRPHLIAAAMVAGNLVIYAFGAPVWMAVTGASAADAFLLATLPFVPGDLIKIALATALVPGAWAAVRAVRRD